MKTTIINIILSAAAIAAFLMIFCEGTPDTPLADEILVKAAGFSLAFLTGATAFYRRLRRMPP